MYKKYDVIVDPADGQRYYVDPVTGEVVQAVESGCLIIRPDQIQARREAAERWQRLQADRSAPQFGAFAWLTVPVGGVLFPGLSAAHTVQLLYLLTTMDYTGRLLASVPRLTAEAVADVLGSQPRDAKRLITACIQAGYLSADANGALTASSGLVSRGEIRERQPGCFYTRMYFPAVRNAYDRQEADAKEALYYLSRILPYVNLRYNVVCENPTEYRPESIRPLTWSALCARIGYSRGHAARISRLLFHTTVPTSGGQEAMLVRIKGPPVQMPKGIYLNPRLFYAGSVGNAQHILPQFAAQAADKPTPKETES